MGRQNERVYDAIVIGSGIGGMTAASMFARLKGMQVLVLEQHAELGGQTHEFRREGFSWDVGLHYVGEMHTGTPIRKFMDFASGGGVRWIPMPKEFERFVYPGFTFDVPSDPMEYRARLMQRYPGQAKAIKRYFSDIQAGAAWHVRDFVARIAPPPIAAVLRFINLFGTSRATMSTRDYLAMRFTDPELRSLLATQWGDYGLPPAESAFAIHSLIVSHYLHGASFPEGGAGRISRFMEMQIEKQGGACRVGYEVKEILVRNGRAYGVRAAERFAPGAPVREFRSPLIISDVGVKNTFGHLLQEWPSQKLQKQVASLGRGYSAVTLYLGLSDSPAKLGIKGENWWIYDDANHDDIDGLTEDLLAGRPRHAYLSFPSLKKSQGSPSESKHTMEMISFVKPEAFDTWRSTNPDSRGADYRDLKEKVTEGLLDFADKHLPGIRKLVAYAELSTPLSVLHYTRHPGGVFYGLAARPERYLSGGFSPKTPIKGLYLSGSDVSSLGIAGALMGGVAAASMAIGRGGFAATFMGRLVQAHGPEEPRTKFGETMNRTKAIVVGKTEVCPAVWELALSVDELPDFEPGQFAKLRVSETEWREYSIVEGRDHRITFLIAAKPSGCGSRFIRDIQVDQTVDIELPFGQFLLKPSAKRKVFIATGTGIAPMIPQIARLAESGFGGRVDVLFGCPYPAHDVSSRYLASFGAVLDLNLKVCISREPASASNFPGRVTGALEQLDFESEQTEFYIAGNPRMVEEAQRILDGRGARLIQTERY